MLRFTVKISALLLVIFGTIILWPINRHSAFNGLENDCYGYASWMYDRLHNNPIPVDIAFVGSSHTITGIDDQQIQRNIPDTHFLNFGYCRPGRNLDYLMVRELIECKNPEIIILELREFDNPYSHPMFPFLAKTQDVLSSYPWFNKDWFHDIFLATQYKVQLIQEDFWETASDQYIDSRAFGRIPHMDTADIEILKAKIEKNKTKYQPTEWKRKLDHVFPHHYLEEIVELCQNSNTELIFLYIPSYGSTQHEPYPTQYLQQFGPIWLPPQEIWENPNHWFDDDHLNQAGAERLSKWVTDKLKQRR